MYHLILFSLLNAGNELSISDSAIKTNLLIMDVSVEQALSICEINRETFTNRYKKDVINDVIDLISNREYQLKQTKSSSTMSQGEIA